MFKSLGMKIARQVVVGIARMALIAAGTYITNKGWVDGNTWDQVSGAALILVTGAFATHTNATTIKIPTANARDAKVIGAVNSMQDKDILPPF